MEGPSLRSLMQILDEIVLSPLIARKQTIFDDNERRMFLQRVLYARPMPIIFYERISELIKERTGIKISQAHMVEATSIYRASYDINAFFAMRTTVAYSVRPEFAVVATRRLERSTFIKGLTGILIPMEDTGEPPSPDTRRSTIVTHGKRHTMQLMGPLSRVNHDCRDYSTELVKIESILGFGQLAVRSVREILPGEEITFNYGSDYFGPGNEDCMCASCSSRWTDPSISDVGDGTRTRKGLLAVKQASLANTIYTYDEVPPQPGANNAREYLSNLPDEASERCMALHCRMRFTSLPFGALCTCCAEQISILDPAPDTLHRYYQSVLTGGHVLGLYHTKLPLHTVRDYLQTLALPDFRVFPRPLRFNSKLHKNHAQNPKNNPSFDANDSSAGSTCDAAAAAGANQKGHIWMLIGDWRSEGSTNLAKFGSGQLPLYACLVILRHNTVYIMDPCYVTTEESTSGHRLSELQSLQRARYFITLLRSPKHKVNMRNGIWIGSWRPLSYQHEVDLSFFSCFEFLEELKVNPEMQASPGTWAMEQVAR